MTDQARMDGKACRYCAGEPEPGFIEMPNNGPLVHCPVCNPEPDDYTKAEMQRDLCAQPKP